MGRPEKPLAQDAGPATAFARELRRLRAAAGSPSYRELAKRALFSASVLSDAAAGYRLPTLQVALAFAEACGGDRMTWERLWREAARCAGEETGPGPKAAHQAQESRLRAAAVRALLPAPAQLPMEPRPLAGRARQLSESRLLTVPGDGPAPPLLIHGQAGGGKSALALRLARELAADLPDGQLYVSLDPAADGRKDAAGIAGGLLQSLGIAPEHIPNDPAQRVGLYRSVLHERRLLVVLDGVLQERQVRELLVAAPHSRIVVTARSRLLGLDGVRRLALPVLDRDESMELLAGIVGEDRLACAPRAGLLLAEACGDLPLALVLAGRWLAARPEALLGEAVAELVAGDGLFDRLRVGDESLTERYEASYRRLTPWARLVLRQFAAAKTAPSVNTVAHRSATALARSLERPAEPVEDLLETLVDSGLLERTDVPGQYGLPPLVRQFALSRADPTASGPDCAQHAGRDRSAVPAP
ncbi:transcriptional regulator [Streptomyces hygroscopicus]|uniref:XRE family transcriptional regulator n=1 Tax=Streptomyces hygroscopicus TaxID=1912 RepID=UPI00223F9492|nr:XRE family transcriptional regulator [Streptomyces hygroscopicus]MCW7944234.1 transcriptional regulator [Streptomyces hygroscopicus]